MRIFYNENLEFEAKSAKVVTYVLGSFAEPINEKNRKIVFIECPFIQTGTLDI